MVTEDLEVDRVVAKTVLPQQGHAFVHDLARGFVLVKEIATQQDHIDLKEGKASSDGSYVGSEFLNKTTLKWDAGMLRAE